MSCSHILRCPDALASHNDTLREASSHLIHQAAFGHKHKNPRVRHTAIVCLTLGFVMWTPDYPAESHISWIDSWIWSSQL
jgi:hypothetical protein